MQECGEGGDNKHVILTFQFLFSSSYHKFFGNFPISKEIFGRTSENWMRSCFTRNAFDMRIRPIVSNKNILPELIPGGFIKIAVNKQSWFGSKEGKIIGLSGLWKSTVQLNLGPFQWPKDHIPSLASSDTEECIRPNSAELSVWE